MIVLRRSVTSYVIWRGCTRAFLCEKHVGLVLTSHCQKVPAVNYSTMDQKKVQETLSALKDDVKRFKLEQERHPGDLPKEEKQKLSVYRKVVNELKHYYEGFRLFVLECKLSIKYLSKIFRGSSLSRRERQQLARTVADMVRLVPFSIFLIVPLMEFVLPLYVRFFPGMLPSTFQSKMEKELKLRKQLKVGLETAKFLQETIEEMAQKEKRHEKDGHGKAIEFASFMRTVRSGSGYVSNDELFKFSKFFEDELTLDNLSAQQLRALCQLLSIPTIGLRDIQLFQLKLKLKELKSDDQQIAVEGGPDSLSTIELQHACQARGMRSVGLSKERMRHQLEQWLELSLNDDVPESLLLLTRALYLSEEIPFTDRIKTLLSLLPENMAEFVAQKVSEMENGEDNYKERIKLLRSIEKAIDQENKALEEVRHEESEGTEKKLMESGARAEEEIIGAVLTDARETIAQVATALGDVAQSVNPSNLRQSLTSASHIIQHSVTQPLDLKHSPDNLDSLEEVLYDTILYEAKQELSDLKLRFLHHSEELSNNEAPGRKHRCAKAIKLLKYRVHEMVETIDSLADQIRVQHDSLKESSEDVPEVSKISKAERKQVAHIRETIRILNELQDVLHSLKDFRFGGTLDSIQNGNPWAGCARRALQEISKIRSGEEIKAADTMQIIELLKAEDVYYLFDELYTGFMEPYHFLPYSCKK